MAWHHVTQAGARSGILNAAAAGIPIKIQADESSWSAWAECWRQFNSFSSLSLPLSQRQVNEQKAFNQFGGDWTGSRARVYQIGARAWVTDGESRPWRRALSFHIDRRPPRGWMKINRFSLLACIERRERRWRAAATPRRIPFTSLRARFLASGRRGKKMDARASHKS
jgi:hypothetical protein